jgi:hypothetical protein
MKKYIAPLALLAAVAISPEAYATGGFNCHIPSGELQISGTTGTLPGNPLVSDITVVYGGIVATIPKVNVVGYWNDGETFLIRALDSERLEDSLILKYNSKTKLKTLYVSVDGLQDTVKVQCDFE